MTTTPTTVAPQQCAGRTSPERRRRTVSVADDTENSPSYCLCQIEILCWLLTALDERYELTVRPTPDFRLCRLCRRVKREGLTFERSADKQSRLSRVNIIYHVPCLLAQKKMYTITVYTNVYLLDSQLISNWMIHTM